MPKVKQCIKCRSLVGPRSRIYCEYHAGYHAGHAVAMMAAMRAASPEYCEDERNKVRVRMQKIRAKRRKAGVNLLAPQRPAALAANQV